MSARATRSLAVRTVFRAIALFFLSVGAATLWSQPASAWWNDQWTMRKKITLDTSASGASVTDPIGAAPLLVRLHVGNFRFGSAKEDGGDLRFIGPDDKTPLKHHVEKYDSLLGEALIWVGVPDLKPGVKTEIFLYYGNAKVPAAVDAKGTYDPDTVLVYHFNDRGAPAQDVSAWANGAQSALPGADGAIIGQGARLDGQAAAVLPASPSLVIAEGAELTWSVWFKMASLQPRSVLYGRREGPNGLLIGLDNGVPFVEVTNAGNVQRSGEGAAVAASTWHHLAVAAKAGQITVYLDGNPFSTLAAALPTMTGTSTLGRDGGAAPDAAAAPGAPAAPADPAAPSPPAGDAAAPSAAAAPAAASAGFVGDIDELQIAKVARPAGFIKFSAIGQGPDNGKLIAFSVDEETASWLSGYFAVILMSVTLDGWVVIGILAVMAVISWVVMVEKISLLNKIGKGNALFLKHFREAGSDLDTVLRIDTEDSTATLGAHLEPKAQKVMHGSPLYKMFELGGDEIRRRFFGSKATGHRTLSPQSIESIRAVLDSGFVQEVQRLNKMMVMLTIAISGGPFLGLLGTVVGVMITFAAIAATGDVNVNAIAPGIAAALVATVAGLGVAIPALFGYNYLITRIKDMTSEMQVFIDEFITKMAESYHPDSYQPRPDEPHKMAAE